ncbi:hypothetical protein F5Y15DRAFT_196817 [Xylariaceae sp. FL0016]|nr:hypothetical protein F5Y15DRAFT_196817 [Xylariaceae sp. FL0016]
MAIQTILPHLQPHHTPTRQDSSLERLLLSIASTSCALQKDSLFFTLPPELRNHIYELCASAYLSASRKPLMKGNDFRLYQRQRFSPVPALLRSCKRLAQEATTLVYANACRFVRLHWFPQLWPQPHRFPVDVAVTALGDFELGLTTRLELAFESGCGDTATAQLQRMAQRFKRVRWLCVREVDAEDCVAVQAWLMTAVGKMGSLRVLELPSQVHQVAEYFRKVLPTMKIIEHAKA